MTASKRQDKVHFEFRDFVKSKYGNIFEYIDQFPLWAGTQTMMRYLYIYERYRQSTSVPGDIVEFGTWRGATAVFLAKCLENFEPNSPKKVVVFDNFAGLPKPSGKDGSKASDFTGHYKGDKQELQTILEKLDLTDRVVLVEGDAVSTVPNYFKKNNTTLVSLAYFDFDHYAPTKAAYEAINPRLSSGSQLVFDQGMSAEVWGEAVFVKELIQSEGARFETLSNQISRQPEIALVVR